MLLLPSTALIESGLADEFIPELPALALEQDPIHHHKDVLAHTIAVVAKTTPARRSFGSGSRLCSTTSASLQPGSSPRAA